MAIAKERNATVKREKGNADQLYAKHTHIRLLSFRKNVEDQDYISYLFCIYTNNFIYNILIYRELDRSGFIHHLIITFSYTL
jgi:hypothetical protein